jgi:hypothetical protein
MNRRKQVLQSRIQAIPYASINWIRFRGFIAMQNLRLSPPLGNNKMLFILLMIVDNNSFCKLTF